MAESVIVPIVVALIGGPIMLFLRKFDQRNSEQHGANMDVLQRIETKVERLDGRMDDHIEWHVKDGD